MNNLKQFPVLYSRSYFLDFVDIIIKSWKHLYLKCINYFMIIEIMFSVYQLKVGPGHKITLK